MRRYVSYGAVLAGLVLVTGVLSTAVHELLGHGAACLATGGSISSFRIAPGGGGFCGCAYTDAAFEPFITAAGIAIDLITGTIAFGLSRRIRNRYVALFLLVYAGHACLLALYYLSVGLFFGVGDPGAIVSQLELGSLVAMQRGDRHVWVPFAIALPLVAFFFARQYPARQERFLGRLRPWKTLAVLFCAMVPVGIVIAVIPHESSVSEAAERARSGAAFTTTLLATARATQDELRGRPEAEQRAVLEEKIRHIEPPKPEPRGVLLFTNVLAVLVGFGAIAGIIWSRAKVVP